MRRLRPLFIVPMFVGCGDRDPNAVERATHHKTAEVPGVGEIHYTIEIPEGYDGSTRVPLTLALHYGYPGARPTPNYGRGIIEAFRPGLSELGGIIIAPDALGGNWTTEENEKAAVWLTEATVKEYAIDEERILITGFSLGGQGTWHIGYRHQDLFTGAIPVAGRVNPEEMEWTIPVYAIHSDADEVVPFEPAERHADALKGRGAAVEFREVNGLEHHRTGDYAPYVGDGVTWLKTQWD